MVFLFAASDYILYFKRRFVRICQFRTKWVSSVKRTATNCGNSVVFVGILLESKWQQWRTWYWYRSDNKEGDHRWLQLLDGRGGKLFQSTSICLHTNVHVILIRIIPNHVQKLVLKLASVCLNKWNLRPSPHWFLRLRRNTIHATF